MTNQLTIKTLVIATMLLMLVDSSVAIGLLVSVTVLSVCVFGAAALALPLSTPAIVATQATIAYALASRKTEDKDSEIRTPVPSFFSRNFPGRICLEVVTLNTKLTVIGEYNKEQRQ